MTNKFNTLDRRRFTGPASLKFLTVWLSAAVAFTPMTASAENFIFRQTPSIIYKTPGAGETRQQLTLNSPSDTVLRRYDTAALKATAANAAGPVSYTVAPALPTGLTLGTNGSITGQATTIWPETTYTITATDGVGGSLGVASASFKLAVEDRVPLAIDGVTSFAFERNVAGTVKLSPAPAATVHGPAKWVSSKTPPAWLTVSYEGNDLVLSGTPTVLDAVGQDLSFTLSDNYNTSPSHSLRVTVVKSGAGEITLPKTIDDNVTYLATYYQDIAARSTLTEVDMSEITWSVELEQPGDAMIPGVELEEDGTLQGQPLTLGQFSFTIKAVAGDVEAKERYTVTVIPEVASKVAATYNSSCLLTAAGEVYCWGDNTYGKLGNGNTTAQTKPVRASALTGKYTDLAAGYHGHVCALKNDSTVWCWGNGSYGQLGNGANSSSSTPQQVSGLSNVRSISSGYYHSCAIKNDGSMWCWGQGAAVGDPGDGKTSNRNIPVQVYGMSSGVLSMGTGNGYSCASKSDGSVWCWGNGGDGRLGDGSAVTRTQPSRVSGLSNVVAMTGGYHHTCAVKSDKTVACWGNPQDYQLGNGVNSGTFYTPQPVIGLANTYLLTSGDHHSCAIRTDRTVVCWGANGYGQLGDGATGTRKELVTVPGMSNVTSITTIGYHHTCASKSDGSVWCWGENNAGQLGDGTKVNKSSPTRVSGF